MLKKQMRFVNDLGQEVGLRVNATQVPGSISASSGTVKSGGRPAEETMLNKLQKNRLQLLNKT